MSLILEALRKLEREKQAAARPGFVVVPAAQWEPGRSRLGPLLGVAFVAAVFGALGIGLYMGAARTARVRQQVATVATPAPAVAPLPAPATPARTAPAGVVDAAPAVRVTPAVPVPAHVEAPLAESKPALTPTTSAAATRSPVVEEPAVAATPESPEPAFVLTAIGARDGRPVAVIDDRLVAEGEEHDGWKVLAIGAESVEILYRGERRVLRFP